MNVEKYDYSEAVYKDVKNYVEEHIQYYDTSSLDKFKDKVYDDMYSSDQVTGNASGSYTFSTWKAEEYLCHNLGLLRDAMDCLGYEDYNVIDKPEFCDILIRCLLLNGAAEEYFESDEFYELWQKRKS